MTFALLLATLVSVPVVAQSPTAADLTPELSRGEIFDGWLSLFDGQTLYGWTAVTDANWRVKDGSVVVTGGQPGLLRTTSQFDDFEMLVEFKAGPNTNSGLFLRTSPNPRNVLTDCYEINLAPAGQHPFSTGALVGRQKTAWTGAADQWHTMRVLADGPKIKVWIDDQKTVDYEDPQPLGRGYVALQFNSGPVEFRRIRLKPLNQQPLFDGKNLDGWRTDQAMESRFGVTDAGELTVTGGRGQIESKATFGDAIISLQARTNRKGLNSGVFFRCIPGELMNGYESQIQNQIVDGDPRRPVDCGTGGIFRRQDARRVVAEDEAWFAKTIVAVGPHISIWVNGYQVSDWTDTRKPDANPRRGYRSEAGSVILQGHDPTTDLLFRDIRARELSPRR